MLLDRVQLSCFSETKNQINKPVSADTISNWIKHVLIKSGINTSLFSAHSTRSASTSLFKPAQIPVNTMA